MNYKKNVRAINLSTDDLMEQDYVGRKSSFIKGLKGEVHRTGCRLALDDNTVAYILPLLDVLANLPISAVIAMRLPVVGCFFMSKETTSSRSPELLTGTRAQTHFSNNEGVEKWSNNECSKTH